MTRWTEGNGRLIAELVGAVAVLVGFIFVGFELRQNSAAVSERTLVYQALFNRLRSPDRRTNILAESVSPRGPEEIVAGIAEYQFQSTDLIEEAETVAAEHVNLIAESEYSDIFTSEPPCGPSWTEYSNQFGADRLYRISDVGITADAGRAVVYVEYEIRCYRGASFIRFEKDGFWRFVEEERVWENSPPEV